MTDEKKKLTGEQLKSDSELGKTKTDERDKENLSEDELNAISGGEKLSYNPCRYGDPVNPFS